MLGVPSTVPLHMKKSDCKLTGAEVKELSTISPTLDKLRV